MANITLTVNMDVPGAEKMSDSELRQLLDDEIIRFLAMRHVESAAELVAAERRNGMSRESTMGQSARHDLQLAHAFKLATWEFSRG